MEASGWEIPEEFQNPPDKPEALAYIWDWFCELQCSSDIITFQEIEAWSRLTAQIPTPAEVEMIRRLSRSYLSIVNAPK